jgi:hypothetical protein
MILVIPDGRLHWEGVLENHMRTRMCACADRDVKELWEGLR